jgi:hypothetical protein
MADLIPMLAAVAGQAGEESDPSFNSTVLLLHGDGTNGAQNNTFLDGSTNNFTITRNGNVTQGSFGPFSRSSGNLVNAPYDPAVHGGSGYFDGTGDYLSIPDNAAFDLAAGNWTFECWFNLSSLVANNDVFTFASQWASNVSLAWFFYLYNNAGTYQLGLSYSTTGSNQTSLTVNLASAPSVGAWNHVAFVRSGNNFLVFLNGTQVGSTQTLNATIFNGTSAVWVASQAGGGSGTTPNYLLNGYLSNLRLVKGTAVYTSAFTPPTAPLTAITNTSLLLNFTNAGIFDNTGKNNLETVGNAQIDTTTKKYGTGSMEFDGTGDYLILNGATTDAFAFGSGDFTIEFWLNLSSTSGAQIAYDGRPSSEQTTQPTIYMNGASLRYYANGVDRITGANLSTSTWYHIAVSRSGTSTKLFVDGTQSGSTYTDSTVYTNTSARPWIGADSFNSGSPPANFLNGFIDDFRVTKGVARYTANFTAPTKAFADL